MTAKEFFESQLITDANSVIKKHAKLYNRFDMMRFAEAYHRNEVKKLNIPDVVGRSEQLVCYICKTNPVEVEDDICKNCADESE